MASKGRSKVLAHFRRRSPGYDRSSKWVRDRRLLDKIFELAGARGDETVLDLATGTGLVAKRFRGKVREIIGLDISKDMTRRAAAHVDRMFIAPMESIPLEPGSVDVCVCRQGLQFADLRGAIRDVVRVLRPGGRAVFCHLAAFGDDDRADAFKIQALRNPARVNFFKPGDLEALLESSGLTVTRVVRHISKESVNDWINHGAIGAGRRKAIHDAYRRASREFKRLHAVKFAENDIIDSMLLLIIRAEKPR